MGLVVSDELEKAFLLELRNSKLLGMWATRIEFVKVVVEERIRL
jgi:hypothetical protein